MFLKTLLFSGSMIMLKTASGGNPTLTLRFKSQREPLGTVTCNSKFKGLNASIMGSKVNSYADIV